MVDTSVIYVCLIFKPRVTLFQIPEDVIDSSRIPINPGFGVMRLAAENLLCHPFLVLRRQCQV